MKILFTHSYFMHFDPKQWGLQQAYPPLMTLYAASVLREAGHEVGLFDTMFSESPQEIIPRIAAERPDVLIICDDGFNYLTKMCLTNMREAAWEMAAIARDHGCRVIVASSDATDHYEKYLDHHCDIVVNGEPEFTLKELMEAPGNQDAAPENIHGISFRKAGKTITTPARAAISEPDLLPLPAWDLADLPAYAAMWRKRYGYFMVNMVMSRGCPFHCTWCAKPLYGYRYAQHSPAYVIHHLSFLADLHPFEGVWFCDDIFALNGDWLKGFSNGLREAGLKIRYKMQSRADVLLREGYISDLKSSGCDTVWLGAESGSQKILDAMNKGVKVEQIFEATRELKAAGIRPAFFIQFGYPGEQMEDIRMTIRMIRKLLPDDIGISVSYPLPGTLFHQMVKDDLREKANWTDSDELAMMFRNTYPPAFYKRLHRYVHKTYRLHQGWHILGQFFLRPWKVRMKDIRRMVLIVYYIPASLWAAYQLNRSRNV